MTIFSFWTIVGIIVLVLLIIYFKKGSNSVWGGLTIGVIIGFIIAVISAAIGKGFNWQIIVKISIVATLIGYAADLLGKISDIKRRRAKQ